MICRTCGQTITSMRSDEQEWGWKIGETMYFCTYSCMRKFETSGKQVRTYLTCRKTPREVLKNE